MPARRTPAVRGEATRPAKRAKQPDGRTEWGSIDWSHAPTARFGTMGNCVHCKLPAILRHPLTNQPCHKVCEEAAVL